MHIKRSIITLVYLILFIGVLRADNASLNSGTITGRVLNAVTREPLTGANVLILNTNLGAAADASGRFEIRNVPAGTYSLRASMIGFTSSIRTDIVVSAARPAEITFSLTESSVSLDEVTVLAEYFQKLPGASLSTQSQSFEEIRRLPGGLEDVVRAVSILPGVALVQPGRNDLIVRGGAPSENLFIIENIEVPNINHFGTQGATGGPTSFINLDFVSGTTFSTGGFGVQYGDRLSSVLTIDLREGRDDRFGGKATISATQFGLNLEGPAGSDGSYLFSARRSYLDFIFRAAGFSFVPEYWDFLTKADYRPDTKNRFTFLGIGALNNVRIFNDTDERRFDNSRILYSNQDQYVAGASWQRLFASGFSTISLGQSYVRFDFRQNDEYLNPVFRNRSIEHETSLRGDVVVQLSRESEITFGAQLKLVRFTADMYAEYSESGSGGLMTAEALFDTLAYKGAAYAQFNRRFGRLAVTLGVRADYFNMIDRAFAPAPRLAVRYSLSGRSNLNASIGRYYQAPAYIWLAAHPQNRSLTHIGADQFILGIDHLLRTDTRISLEGYLKRYFDYPASAIRHYLVMANTGAGYGGADEEFASFGLDPLLPAGSGTARGFELFVQKKLSDIPGYGTFSVSYNISEYQALDGVRRPSSYDQRWIVNLGGGYIVNKNWEVSAKFRFASGRPYTPFDENGIRDLAQYNSIRISPNHSLDIRADRRWNLDRFALVAYLDIQNVYNRKARDVPRYNRRTATFENTSSIGILPSIGLSLEF